MQNTMIEEEQIATLNFRKVKKKIRRTNITPEPLFSNKSAKQGEY